MFLTIDFNQLLSLRIWREDHLIIISDQTIFNCTTDMKGLSALFVITAYAKSVSNAAVDTC